jgi:hypothetical protein
MTYYPCTLNFYNNRKKLIFTHSSDEYLVYSTKANRHAFGTPNEYNITLEYLVNKFKFEDNKRLQLSYCDVLHQDTFIARHYIRQNQLSPIVGYVEDTIKDELIRLKHIAFKPQLEWHKMLMDKFWGRKLIIKTNI